MDQENVAENEVVQTVDEPSKQQSQVQCPFCNEIILHGAKKCKHCGEFLDNSLRVQRQVKSKSRGVFIVLGLFLGCLGIHNFYAGYNGKGAIQLLITIFLGWAGIGIVITAIWAIIDIITISKDANGTPWAL